MKTKFSKILGVGLTLVMVLALTAGFALPVGASPDENAWSKLAYPVEGEVGGFFYDSTIGVGPGPIAKAIDGTLYAYAEVGATPADELLKSTDGGRSWALTYYSNATYGVVGIDIVAIACSSIDADIVYVADAADVYKTEDAGDNWEVVGDFSGDITETITCLDVGYADDKPYVYVGTADDPGDVYYLYDVAFGGGWTDLDVSVDHDDDGNMEAGMVDVYGLAVSPDFDSDALVAAVVTDDTTPGSNNESFVCVNRGADIGQWTDVEIGADVTIDEASDPAFPEDFDAADAYEFFVGTCDATAGHMYRVYGETDAAVDELDYVDVDIISLDLVGEVGDTMLLAGAQDTADVWWSTDDGDTWDNAAVYGIAPTGAGQTCVLMDDDFADNGTAWAATSGAEGAVSLSVDSGEIWHGISLIFTAAINEVVGVALSPAYATDETLFLLTTDIGGTTESVFKYDGANWLRVFESTQYTATADADLVAVSPDFATDETVLVGCTGSLQIFRSTDIGNSFTEQRVAPTAITAWTIIDSDTIIAGGNGTVHKTENYGRRVWADYAVTGSANNIASFAVVGETIMVGDAAGLVFVSEDAGETWEQVGSAPADLGIAAAAIVASDGDIIYAACGDVVGRCVIDTGEDWADQVWEEIETPTTTISQSAAADNFTMTCGVAGVINVTQISGAVAVVVTTDTDADTTITFTPATGVYLVTFGDAGDAVTVYATGIIAPVTGTIASPGAATISATTKVDTDSDATVPASLAAGATAGFVLPDLETAVADVVTAGLQAASGVVIAPDGTLYVVDATAGVGVWRSLNPDAEFVADVVSEAITYKLTATPTLALAGFSVGSNVLWATDGATPINLWAYEDGLATEVILNSPISGNAVSDTDKATLGWFELTGAEEYEIDVNTRDDFLTGTAIAVADVEETWVTVDGLDPGTTYYWRVRVAAADPLLSRYSETRSFITALERVTPPDMWSPENGADDATLEPIFSWGEVTGATNYKIVVATEPGFGVASRLVETMVTTHFYACDVRLSYNTTYYWRVKAYSDSVVVSDWRAGMFTTMAKPVPVTPPVEISPPSPAPEVTVEVPPAVEVIVPAAQVISPTWIYVIIGVGAVLAIAVIVLIVRTRRVS